MLSIAVIAATAFTGCGPGGGYTEGPTVDRFTGRLTASGGPVAFGADELVLLNMTHKESKSGFGVPIKPDGTFDIGWMPVGSYSVNLTRGPSRVAFMSGNEKGVWTVSLPEFTIAEGQTEYTIDLPANWDKKPDRKKKSPGPPDEDL